MDSLARRSRASASHPAPEPARADWTRATFRIAPKLQGFLAQRLRQQLAPGNVIGARFPPHSTLRHAVEALGIPHTELGLLRLNRHVVHMDARLAEDGEIDVLPHPHAQAPLPDLRFLADAHLGGLARLLRMSGFDTAYDNAAADEEIEKQSQAQERIVLTRDRDLLKRRGIARGCYLWSQQAEPQWHEVDARYGLRFAMQALSLCLRCNASLQAAPASEALRAPPDVLQRHGHLSWCAQCRRLYWEGSHWQRMQQRLAGWRARVN